MDIGYSIKEGVARATRNWKLVFLIFGTNLLLAAIVALPLAGLIDSAFANRGFSEALAAKFDIELWFDAMEKIGPSIQSYLFPQIFWIVLVYLVWKVALSLGLIARLKEEPMGFWQGVGRFFPRGLALGLIYFIVTFLGMMLIFTILMMMSAASGEVGIFWISFALLPTAIITWVSILDLMHDYSRIHLVERDAGIFSSLGRGLLWPFKNGSASVLYVFWFLVSAAVWFLPFIFDAKTASATALSIFFLLIVQQVMLLIRSAFSVAWFGSEVAFYERRAPAPEEVIEYIDSELPEGLAAPDPEVQDFSNPSELT